MKKIEENDFGFTMQDVDEVSPITKLNGLRDMIMPLLNNLKKNPEKDMINWPNRTEKIDAFIKKMDDYINS